MLRDNGSISTSPACLLLRGGLGMRTCPGSIYFGLGSIVLVNVTGLEGDLCVFLCCDLFPLPRFLLHSLHLYLHMRGRCTPTKWSKYLKNVENNHMSRQLGTWQHIPKGCHGMLPKRSLLCGVNTDLNV